MFRISFFNMLSELENYSGSKARCCLSCRLRNHFDDNFPFLCHLKKKKKERHKQQRIRILSLIYDRMTLDLVWLLGSSVRLPDIKESRTNVHLPLVVTD